MVGASNQVLDDMGLSVADIDLVVPHQANSRIIDAVGRKLFLTWNSHLVQWGDRITPLAISDIELPPCDETALELIAPYLTQQRRQLQSQIESVQQADLR